VDVKAVGKEQHGATLQMLGDVAIQILLRKIRHQHGNEVRASHRDLGDCNLEAVTTGLQPTLAALAQPDHDVEAAVLEIKRMGATLAAISEHGKPCALQGLAVDIFLGRNSHHQSPECPKTHPKHPPATRHGGAKKTPQRLSGRCGVCCFLASA